MRIHDNGNGCLTMATVTAVGLIPGSDRSSVFPNCLGMSGTGYCSLTHPRTKCKQIQNSCPEKMQFDDANGGSSVLGMDAWTTAL